MRGVDGQRERRVAVVDRALDAVLDKGLVAADIELVDAQRIGRRLRDVLQPRLGYRAQHMRGAKAAGAAHHRGTAFGVEGLQRADRRQHDRQPQFAAHYLQRGIDLADVAQYAGPERDLVQRHAVTLQRGLGLRAADDVVPGVLVEVGARLGDQLVQVLEILWRDAAFSRLDFRGLWWRIVGSVLHRFSFFHVRPRTVWCNAP